MILNLGFLTEGKLAAILITPSSWGSQRAGHSPRIMCHQVRESFTDQFSHNTDKSLIRRIDKSKSNVLWNSKLLIGKYGGHIGITWFLGVGCTSRAHTQYKMRAIAKDWEGPTKRAKMVIIMQSDKATLREA
jgi:hypothetical protein